MSSPNPNKVYIQTPGQKAKNTTSSRPATSPKTTATPSATRIPAPTKSSKRTQSPPQTPSRASKSPPQTPSRASHARSTSDPFSSSSSGLNSILRRREDVMNPTAFSRDAGREDEAGRASRKEIWNKKRKDEEKAPEKNLMSPPKRGLKRAEEDK